jgi:amino acid adenylation domain
VRQVALAAYAHQEVPFERVVEALRPQRSLSHSPLFQVMFVLQNVPFEALELPGLSLSPLALESVTTKFDLTLVMSETERGLVGAWEYNSDLFEAATLHRLGEHFQCLLRGVVVQPEQRLAELPLLSEAERRQVVVEWNATQSEYPQERCIHQLFEAQVEQALEAVAVVFEEQWLTYRALNARANQLAHYLQALGVGPEGLVGICMERSVEMVVGLLGILKAGGAYVPLDPAYPEERLAFMLEDAQVPVLLTQERLGATLPKTTAQVFCLDREWERLRQAPECNPPSSVSPEDLAYMIYTSGSTGRPKGVSVIHRGVVRLVKETNYADLTAEEVFLQLAPLSFDACTFEIWGCLLNGAQLVVMPPHTPSLEELGQAIYRYYVTTLWLTAGLFHLMVDEQLDDLKSVRQLLAGGDVLSVPHTQKVLQAFGKCRLINGYGPTENTTFTCCYPMTVPGEVGSSVPIGRPIANTQVYLLDRQLHPMPIGVPGELYIGGDGLARDYFRRPELTAEKFIPHPFSEVSGARLYKTGDLARYLPGGNLEFLGRVDHQVKVRGFRIELGEIETVLGGHPGVREACVVVREDHPGEKRLVAYYVGVGEAVVESEGLRRYLQAKLPEYMIPAAFVVLEAWPLTPNGKVDRRALPAPERGGAEEGYEAPRTPTEELLAGFWAEVLRQERVGRHDNFFALGGDSILSIQIIARAHQAGLQLTPKQLFQHQSIAELAAVAGVGPGIKAEQGVVSGVVALTPIQRWFFERDLAEPQHFNQSLLLEVGAELKPGWVQRVVWQLVGHHDALRLRFFQEGSEWQQVNAGLEEAVPFGVVDLSELAEEEQPGVLEGVVAVQQGSLNLSVGRCCG